MRLVITTEETYRRADEVVYHLLGPRLWVPQFDYPDLEDWVKRAHTQLKAESKRAVLALSQDQVLGAVVYQRHREDSSILEVKNISVRPDSRGRHIASFLLRNAEIEGAHDFLGTNTVRVDAKAHNLEMQIFLYRNGYLGKGVGDIYRTNSGPDRIYEKKLTY